MRGRDRAVIKLYVGITDRGWFDALAASPPDEVNFWQPSGSKPFRVLRPGELFLFKLHAPDNYIVGGGVFSHATEVPLSLAWDAFGAKNGVGSLTEMRRRIAKYRRDDAVLDHRHDPVIGCRILTAPFFWPREQWVPIPPSFARQTVSGKGYRTDERDGRALWDAVQDRQVGRGIDWMPIAERADQWSAVRDPAAADGRFGQPALIAPRLGQGAFRLAVTDAYERRCVVSGERTLPILDAAHVKAHAAGGDNAPSNGLLLRTDIHRLFDLGYVTVAPDNRFEVSRRLKDDFDNGKHYYDLAGVRVRQTVKGFAPVSPAALEWHRQECYLG